MIQTMEQRLIELETKVAYQEDTIQQLNDVLSEQQSRLDQFEATLLALHTRLQALSENGPDLSSKEEKPPHY